MIVHRTFWGSFFEPYSISKEQRQLLSSITEQSKKSEIVPTKPSYNRSVLYKLVRRFVGQAWPGATADGMLNFCKKINRPIPSRHLDVYVFSFVNLNNYF